MVFEISKPVAVKKYFDAVGNCYVASLTHESRVFQAHPEAVRVGVGDVVPLAVGRARREDDHVE